MKLALIGVAALTAAASVTPALAQQVIEDPGYCAQFYPNGNCQNKGPGNPYGHYQLPGLQRNDWASGETVGVAPKRSRTYPYGSPAARIQ